MSQEIRKKIIDKHVEVKGYKTISKQIVVSVITVANIYQRFKVHRTVTNIPGRGCKRKIDYKLRMVTKEPRTTFKEISSQLQGQGTSMSDCPVRCGLSHSGSDGRR